MQGEIASRRVSLDTRTHLQAGTWYCLLLIVTWLLGHPKSAAISAAALHAQHGPRLPQHAALQSPAGVDAVA